MKLPEDCVLLRVFIGESDQYKGRPLYEQIVLKARELNLAGATVIRGIMGYGAQSRIIHTTKLLELSTDLPVIIEIVDEKQNIDRLLPYLDETIADGLVTLEKMKVLKYRHKDSK
jgi:PII-like signaling protein